MRYLVGVLDLPETTDPAELAKQGLPMEQIIEKLKARDIGRSFTERTLVKACRTVVARLG